MTGHASALPYGPLVITRSVFIAFFMGIWWAYDEARRVVYECLLNSFIRSTQGTQPRQPRSTRALYGQLRVVIFGGERLERDLLKAA